MANDAKLRPARLAIFISGRGSGMRAIMEAITENRLFATVPLVVSSNPDAAGLVIAAEFGAATYVAAHRLPEMTSEQAAQLLAELKAASIDAIVLAGYIKHIPAKLLAAFPHRVINIHPALLPAFGGKGMYGQRVHEAVLASGATESGATVHLVTEQYDQGAILAQARVPVLPDDTPDSLAARVLACEHEVYPRAIQQFIETHLKHEN